MVSFDDVKRVLKEDGSIILGEITGADLSADVDDLLAAVAAIGADCKTCSACYIRRGGNSRRR